MASSTAFEVYKNEDVNNPEYATFTEVLQAFFGRGVFVKDTYGSYYQVTRIDPRNRKFSAAGVDFKLAVPK